MDANLKGQPEESESSEGMSPEELFALIPGYEEPSIEDVEDADPGAALPESGEGVNGVETGKAGSAEEGEVPVELFVPKPAAAPAKRSPLPLPSHLTTDPSFMEEAEQGEFLRTKMNEALLEYVSKYGREVDIPKLSRLLCRIALKSAAQRPETYFDSFKVGNAIGLFAPPIAALIHNPGADASQDDALDSMQKIMHAANKLADGFYQKIMERASESPSDKRFEWVRNKLRTVASELVSKQWAIHSSVDMSEYSAMFDDLLSRIDLSDDPAFLHFGDLNLNRDLALTLSLTKAIEPVMGEVRVFDFLQRDHVALIRDICDEILVSAQDAVAPFSAKGADGRSLLILTQSMINRAGTIYAACWASEGEKVTTKLSEMDEALLGEFLAKYPEGLPLDQMKKNFKLSFERFADVVRQSIASFEDRAARTAQPEGSRP